MFLASMRRRFSFEGQSFQVIKDTVQRDQTFELLAHKSLSIAEVASKVGFKDPGSLHRAIRKWTGTTPRTCWLKD